MRKSWQQIKDETFSKSKQRQLHELAMKELAKMELAELREALEVRQTELAKKMKTTQVAVSRMERRPNVMLSSISNYIEALGGKLELRAVLPNRTIRLTSLLATTGKRKKRAGSAKRMGARTAASA
jgi:DNA-binding transcriptional regulator YiaG